MPGLVQNDHHCQQQQQVSNNNTFSTSSEFWSKQDHVSYNQLRKFWSGLSPHARQKLLRMDKQTLFEHARKNLYCSRCNGLLLEVFLQIVTHGKSLQQEGAGAYLSCSKSGVMNIQSNGLLNTPNGSQDEAQDPSVHPWGGLTTTRDGTLTLLDCYLYSKPLEGLQNVFDSARARERERILLYPHACGTGERGWISSGITPYGRVHATRETCPLHTARLSCDTLVDFWSALVEETRQSLFRMKEEDFTERLMYRFDSKRFCRDCRRNVIREFKELKELKRMRRETRCTSSFCVADTAFQYEMTETTIQADWRQTFTDTVGTYHHFEWAVGSAEGKCDILDFENVGMNRSVQVNGLDLAGFRSCYITLRAWKLDGRCTEHCVKAHALKGQQCVHCRLVVGDGYVTINKGESIRRFFEHAEEAEEEEDDDSMDKDGNELDEGCSRPQKHAKSPELAREFLLDAGTVIFKEQVEKAFREGTARQNAHSVFVCLALKLLEERVHVAFKEIITLEKQTKLLEEEEKEKQEEEERKEKRRAKEREKKLRRKERLKGKDKDKSSSDSNEIPDPHNFSKEDLSPSVDEESNSTIVSVDPVCETDGTLLSSRAHSCDQDEHLSDGYVNSEMQNRTYDDCCDDGGYAIVKVENSSFSRDNLKYSRRRIRVRKDFQSDPTMKLAGRCQQYAAVSETAAMPPKSEPRVHHDHFDPPSRVSNNGLHRQIRNTGLRSNNRSCGTKFIERPHFTSNRYGTHSFSSNQSSESYSPVDTNGSTVRTVREAKFISKSESASETTRQYHRSTKFNQVDYMHDNSCGRPKSKTIVGNHNSSSRDSPYVKKVWEPMEPQKYHKSNSDSNLTLISSSTSKVGNETTGDLNVSSETVSCDTIRNLDATYDEASKGRKCSDEFSSSGRVLANTDNCSLYPSEGDSTTHSITSPHHSSSTSESEDATHKSEEREVSAARPNGAAECYTPVSKTDQITNEAEPFYPSIRPGHNLDSEKIHMGSYQHQGAPNQNLHYSPTFQTPPTMAYHHQNPIAWPQAPANNLMVFPHHPNYVYTSPFSYGLNGNSPYCLPYGSMQSVSTPLVNQGQVPLHHHPVSKVNCVSNGNTVRTRVAPDTQRPIAAPASTNDLKTGFSANSNMENTGFSLFHFGGPLSNLSSNISDARNEGDHSCYKKDTTIEEYNLFSARNGLQFSLF